MIKVLEPGLKSPECDSVTLGTRTSYTCALILIRDMRLETCSVSEHESELSNKLFLNAFENFHFVRSLDTSNHMHVHGCMDPWNACENAT